MAACRSGGLAYGGRPGQRLGRPGPSCRLVPKDPAHGDRGLWSLADFPHSPRLAGPELPAHHPAERRLAPRLYRHAECAGPIDHPAQSHPRSCRSAAGHGPCGEFEATATRRPKPSCPGRAIAPQGRPNGRTRSVGGAWVRNHGGGRDDIRQERDLERNALSNGAHDRAAGISAAAAGKLRGPDTGRSCSSSGPRDHDLPQRRGDQE